MKISEVFVLHCVSIKKHPLLCTSISQENIYSNGKSHCCRTDLHDVTTMSSIAKNIYQFTNLYIAKI